MAPDGYWLHSFDRRETILGAVNEFYLNRRPGLPDNYSIKDMANDYAEMVKEEFDGPVDVIGSSTGGSIAQHFAANHSDLVRRLILHSSAYTLNDSAKRLQMCIGVLASQYRWREAYAKMLGLGFPNKGVMKYLNKPIVYLGSFLSAMVDAPNDPSDLVVTIKAKDKHNFKDLLVEITAPTLVSGGDKDPFYSESLLHETVEGIPNAKLALYKGEGHPASGKQF